MALKSDDGSLTKDSAMVRLMDNLNLAAGKFGKLMNIAPTLKSAMEEAGFVKAVDEVYKSPVGT